MANSDALVDAARAVRAGEELDTARLRAWLAAHVPAVYVEGDGDLRVEQFPSGHSNLTYLVRVGERELVLRRPPFGSKVKSAHDMGREFRILSALEHVYDKAPRPIGHCDDPEVLGAPFYLMERVRGVVLRGLRPSGLVALSPPEVRRVSETLVDALCELHAVPIDAPALASLGRPEGYAKRQVEGWSRRYFDARTDDIPSVERVAAWLAGRIPPDRDATLVHNDYKYDNVVFAADDLTRIVAVLDWELCTIGDPLMDLGTALGYWVDQDDPEENKLLPFGPTAIPGNLSRAEIARRYAERTGRSTDEILFHYVFALLKIAVIAQQIYKRFVDGHTRDPRFGAMIMGVRILGETAVRAIDRNRISQLG